MINNVNTHRPTNRTFAVIDGGIRKEIEVQTCSQTPKPKLLDQVREAIRMRHYSPKTEESYVHWIKRFICFHNKRHPAEMGEKEIAQYLSSLTSELHVSASTQNQALNAILFLYRQVLRKDIGYVDGVIRAKKPRRTACSADKRGGQERPGALKWHSVVDVNVALRRWTATDGMLSIESQRHRFFPESNTRSSGQRRQRPA